MRYLVLVLAVAGCSFDRGGIAADDDDDGVPIDAATVDAASGDAPPPDAGNPDRDGDTVLNEDDNCPDLANLDQHDEDGDTVGDVCDNCPHVPNIGQEHAVDADQVGDACDPHPGVADAIVYFDPFKGTGVPQGYSTIGTGSWSQADDKVVQSSSASGSNYLVVSGVDLDDVVVETSVDVGPVLPSAGGGGAAFRSVGTMTRFTAGTFSGTGYMCLILDDYNDNENAWVFAAGHQDNGATDGDTQSPPLGDGLQQGQNYRVRAEATADDVSCTQMAGSPVTVSLTDTAYTSGSVALRTNTASASFRYLVVIAPAP